MPEDDQERDDDTAAARQAEGLRRYDLIRRLLQDEHRSLPAAEMQAAVRTLGVSQTTLYRLVRLYRQHGTVEALQPRPRGRPEGSRLLSRRVETIIGEVIREASRDRPRPTLTYLVEQVHALCAAEGLPRPHRRTIRARYLATDPPRSPRRHKRDSDGRP